MASRARSRLRQSAPRDREDQGFVQSPGRDAPVREHLLHQGQGGTVPVRGLVRRHGKGDVEAVLVAEDGDGLVGAAEHGQEDLLLLSAAHRPTPRAIAARRRREQQTAFPARRCGTSSCDMPPSPATRNNPSRGGSTRRPTAPPSVAPSTSPLSVPSRSRTRPRSLSHLWPTVMGHGIDALEG